jgi:alpha-tubulin suppressor-like RCC1 family protein
VAGAAWCWGSNDPTPKPVAGGLAFVSISAGGSDCGVTITGDGYCWGGVSMPGLISGGLHFASITAGLQSCGVTTSGAAFCWGSNAEGELGDSTTTSRSAPTPVAGGLTFTELAAGYLHTCGIAAGGAAWCWGADSTLGSGITGGRSYPVPVAGGLAFSHIAASGTNKVTCGITTAGAAYCWGAGYDGQLGNGTTLTGSLTPTPVSGEYSFAALSLANNSTCGLTTTGQALCWGYHGRGALGDSSGISSPIPVAVSGGHSFSSIGAAAGSACAVDGAGAAWCWGANDQGELGIGVMGIVLTPTLVTEP